MESADTYEALRPGPLRRGYTAIIEYFWSDRHVSRPLYVVAAASMSLALSGATVALYWLVFTVLFGLGTPPPLSDDAPSVAEMLIGWVIFAPIVETIILAILVAIARRLFQRELVHLLIGALPLGLLHAVQGINAYDAGGHATVSVVSFLVFTAVYVRWRRSSVGVAFWMCAAVHALHNLVLGAFVAVGV